MIARRDVDGAVMLQLHQHGKFVLRLIGEVKTDFRVYRFWLSGGPQMDVQNEIHAGLGPPSHAVGLDNRRTAGFPGKKMAVWIERTFLHAEIHAGKTDAGCLLLAAR